MITHCSYLHPSMITHYLEVFLLGSMITLFRDAVISTLKYDNPLFRGVVPIE